MDIQSLRERPGVSEFSVTQLNNYIKGIFDRDNILRSLTVRGEISNFTNHYSTGHLYFSLKDEGGQIKAIMFRSSASRLNFIPEDGMKVVVRASASVYTASGQYQLYVNSMQPDGVGALYLAYERLRARLEGEGLFSPERKLPLPKYPMKIGVITSPTGAAIRDIINVLTRRFPLAEINLYPSLVQGEGAEENLIRGVDYFDRTKSADVIIIGRGGGSIEDLWAFNGERLARRIAAATVPIISAVGHETDYTICDFVADRRAPTPSAAAELAVRDYRELLIYLSEVEDRICSTVSAKISHLSDKLSRIKGARALREPTSLVDARGEALADTVEDLGAAISLLIERRGARFSASLGRLSALNPISVLARGYAAASFGGRALTSARQVNIGDTVSLRLCDGELVAKIKEKSEIKNGK